MMQSNNKLKILALCGILAPIVYITALVVGNILDPSYSQIGKTVSELIQQGTPTRDLLNAIFIIYNILNIPFALGMFYGLRKGWARNLIFVALVINGILGVAWTLFFPLDIGGKSVSLTGQLHLIVGALVVPLIFAFGAIILAKRKKRRPMERLRQVLLGNLRSDICVWACDSCACKLRLSWVAGTHNHWVISALG